MPNLKAVLCVLCAVFALGSCQTSFYAATLDAANDDATTMGEAFFNAECSTTSCSYNLTIVDIENVYQAHLHAGNSSVADGPVVVFLLEPVVPYISFSSGVVSSSFNASAFIGPLAGAPFSTLLSEMADGSIYVNVHNEAYPNGVVRGQTAY